MRQDRYLPACGPRLLLNWQWLSGNAYRNSCSVIAGIKQHACALSLTCTSKDVRIQNAGAMATRVWVCRHSWYTCACRQSLQPPGVASAIAPMQTCNMGLYITHSSLSCLAGIAQPTVADVCQHQQQQQRSLSPSHSAARPLHLQSRADGSVRGRKVHRGRTRARPAAGSRQGGAPRGTTMRTGTPPD